MGAAATIYRIIVKIIAFTQERIAAANFAPEKSHLEQGTAVVYHQRSSTQVHCL